MPDVTDATFETAVLARSDEVPVVVDLWAEWCGPCKTLGPILERVVGATGGQVELAKLDVDANPRTAQAFQVQSIPAVYALKDRKVVDGFVGAQPESEVQAFVDRLVPPAESTEIERLVEAGDEPSLRAALDIDPDHGPAVLALAEILAATSRGEDAVALVGRLPEGPETRRIVALVRTGDDGDVDVAQRLDDLLDRVKADDDAREEFLQVIELLDDDDPRKSQYRRALAARLF